MVSLFLGIAAALLASTAFAAGTVLQAREAGRRQPGRAPRPLLLLGLVRQPRWLAGLGLTLIGWPIQGLALLLAPLTLVQPVFVVGTFFFLATGARTLNERVGRPEIRALLVLVVGVTLLAIVAPRRTTGYSLTPPAAAALTVVGLGAAIPYVLHRLGRPAVLALVTSAGLGYALSGIATKFAVDALQTDRPIALMLWVGCILAAEVPALTVEMAALASWPVTRVAPPMLTVEIVVPVLLAPVLVGEDWARTAPQAALLGLALVLLTAGALRLASTERSGGRCSGDTTEIAQAARTDVPRTRT